MQFRVYRQLEGMDCGPACIQMVADYYGRPIGLHRLRDYCNVTRLGVSAGDIENGCKAIGLDAQVCFVGKNVIDKIPLPAILHWRQNHFIVLYNIKHNSKGNSYFMADPQYGKVVLSEKVFMDEWIGMEDKGGAILIEPTRAFFDREREKKSVRNGIKKIADLLMGIIKTYPKSFSWVLILSLLAATANWLTPFFFQKAIDIGIGNKDLNIVMLMMFGQLSFFLGYSIFGNISNILLTKIGFNTSVTLLKTLLFKLIKLPISFFDTKLNTDLLQRIEDQRQVQQLFTSYLQTIYLALINFIVFSAILIYYNLYIYLIFLFFSIISLFYTRIFLKNLKILNYSKFTLDSINKNATYELIGGMPEIKINNAQQARITSWEQIQLKLNKTSLKALYNSIYLSSGTSFLMNFAQIIILIACAYFVIQGQMTIGIMMTITYIIGQLSNSTNNIINFIRQAQDTKLSFDRLEEIYRKEDENNDDKKNVSAFLNKGILFKDVSFKYEGSYSPYVLCNVNLFVPKGKATAIVGASGSGKTTLMKLMLAFYYPQMGDMYLDDEKMSIINSDMWRDNCGVVMQDGYIFSGSVAENIALAEIVPNMDKVEKAAKIACIDKFIDRLPLKYNTKIGNHGVALSGGEKQRIFIARAVYKDPQFIFLDEATNSLDANNERAIMENLYEFYKGKTVVTIAHRLSTVRNADQIIVLDNGEIVEKGTHDELTNLKGKYYHLVKNQLELGN